MSKRGDQRVELVDVLTHDPLPGSDDILDSNASAPMLSRWTWLAAAAVAALVIGFVVHGQAPARSSSATRLITHSQRLETPDAARPATVAPLTIVDVGHRLLPVVGRWDVFGLGPGVVVRIQPAQGRITTTRLPPGDGDSPQALVALPGRVIVRPATSGTGYVVADGARASGLTGLLSQAGPVVPGPHLGQLWVRTSSAAEDATRMTLLGPAGLLSGSSIVVPGDGYLSADGTGHVMYTTRIDNESILTAPGRWQVTTSGQLLAAGANKVVSIADDGSGRYSTVVTDVRTHRRRMFTSPGLVTDPILGPVAPDGRTAAVVAGGPTTTTVHLLNLSTGALSVPGIALAAAAESLAWSPDGRWLFAATRGGLVVAIDSHTSTVHRLGVGLPRLNQLVVRPAPTS